MDPADLERQIDAELKRLPAPRAPETLLPRVLAATAQRKPSPWYARPWLAWPLGWQVASAALLVALGVGIAMFMAATPHVAAVVAPHAAAAPLGGIRALARNVEQAATLARVLWQVLLGPVVFWLLIVTVSLSLACALVWSALERAAAGGVSEQ